METQNHSKIEMPTENSIETSSSSGLVRSNSLSRTSSTTSAGSKRIHTVEDIGNETAGMTRKEKIKFLFTAFLPLIITLVIDCGIPLALYYILKNYTSQLVALIVSGIPPLLHVAYTAIRRRKLDILGCIFVLSFVISAVVSIVTGDVRLTLLRDSATTAVISLLFFITLIPIRTKWFHVRPLVFLVSQQMALGMPPVEWIDAQGEKHSVPRMDWSWDVSYEYRRFCYVLTATWSFVLMGEFVAKVVMIEATTLSVDQIILYGNIIIAVVTVTMTLSTLYFSARLQKSMVAKAKIWMQENDYSDKLPN